MNKIKNHFVKYEIEYKVAAIAAVYVGTTTYTITSLIKALSDQKD